MSSEQKHHDYHLIDPSPWPIIGAFSAFIFAVGAIIGMRSLDDGDGVFRDHRLVAICDWSRRLFL